MGKHAPQRRHRLVLTMGICARLWMFIGIMGIYIYIYACVFIGVHKFYVRLWASMGFWVSMGDYACLYG